MQPLENRFAASWHLLEAPLAPRNGVANTGSLLRILFVTDTATKIVSQTPSSQKIS
jgi:hypothetical protein